MTGTSSATKLVIFIRPLLYKFSSGQNRCLWPYFVKSYIDQKLYLVTDCGLEARPWLSAGRQFCVQRHHQAGGDPRREAHADSEADRQL